MPLVSLLSKGAQRKIDPEATAFDLLDEEFINTADFLTDFDRRKLQTIRESIQEYNAVRSFGTALKSTEDSMNFFRDRLHDVTQERMEVALLTAKNTVIKVATIFQGSATQCTAHPREVFREAVKYPTARIILAHNHPSGVLIPSRADCEFTQRMRELGEIMGIEVIDHLIVSPEGATSLAESSDVFW